MKITNLRAKDGFYFGTGEHGNIDLYGEADNEGYNFSNETIEFDVVQPEYKVGDVVKLKEIPSGLELKGLIVSKISPYTSVAVVGEDEKFISFHVEENRNIDTESDFQIVGLWVEEL